MANYRKITLGVLAQAGMLAALVIGAQAQTPDTNAPSTTTTTTTQSTTQSHQNQPADMQDQPAEMQAGPGQRHDLSPADQAQVDKRHDDAEIQRTQQAAEQAKQQEKAAEERLKAAKEQVKATKAEAKGAEDKASADQRHDQVRIERQNAAAAQQTPASQ